MNRLVAVLLASLLGFSPVEHQGAPQLTLWQSDLQIRSLTVSEEDVDKEIEQFASQSGRTPAAVRAQIEKEGGLGRLTAGLRREKAVDLALTRATITDE